MVKTEVTHEELAFESAELLPDRDTMQPFTLAASLAANAAQVNQTATSGAATATGGGDDSTTAAISAAVNLASVTQNATSGDATASYTP